MRISSRVAACGAATLGIASVASLGLYGSASAAAAAHHDYPHSSVVGHVYVDDNPAGPNTIGVFARHSNGSLTPASGSPFAAGGTGLGSGTASQGALQESSDGRYLLAVDAGSNQISVLRINRNGSVSEVGTPVSSYGVKPVSITVTPWGPQDLVYVANAGDGGENYTGFTLDRGGVLRHLDESTIAVPDGSQLGDVLFNADGTKVAGTRVGTGLIDSFNVGRNGLLYAASSSPSPSQGPGPIGAEFRPTNPSQLYVSNAHGGPNAGTISGFNVSRSGTLSSIGSGPFADNQTAPCWVEISHNGRLLFTTNTAVPSISRYSIARDGSLTLLGTTATNATTEKGPIDLRLSPDGHDLYVVDGGAAAVSSFAVHGGSLTPLTSSPIAAPAGSSPVGVVVN
jgi:6-phosphogluconolactonase